MFLFNLVIWLCVFFRRRLRIKISEFQSFSLLPLIPLFLPVRMSFDLYRVEIDRRRRVPFKLVWGSGPNYVIFGSCWASVSICETCWVLSLVFQIPPEKVLFWGMFLGSKYRPFCGNPSQPGSLIFHQLQPIRHRKVYCQHLSTPQGWARPATMSIRYFRGI